MGTGGTEDLSHLQIRSLSICSQLPNSNNEHDGLSVMLEINAENINNIIR